MKSGSEVKIYVEMDNDNNDPMRRMINVHFNEDGEPHQHALSNSFYVFTSTRKETKKVVRCAWNKNCLWWTNKLIFPFFVLDIFAHTKQWLGSYITEMLTEVSWWAMWWNGTYGKNSYENNSRVFLVFLADFAIKMWLINKFLKQLMSFIF